MSNCVYYVPMYPCSTHQKCATKLYDFGLPRTQDSSHRWRFRLGFRHLKMVHNPGKDWNPGSGVVLMCNNNPHLRTKKSLIRCTQQIALTSMGFGGFWKTSWWLNQPIRKKFPKEDDFGGKTFFGTPSHEWRRSPSSHAASPHKGGTPTASVAVTKRMTRKKINDKSMEIQENPWKTWKPMKIHGNPSTKTWKNMKIQENLMKIHEHPEFSTTRPNVFKIPKSQPLSNQPLTHLPLKNAHLSTRSKSSNCLERFCSKALAFVSQFQKKNAVPTHFNLEP